jgi:signal transduction histidine kinase
MRLRHSAFSTRWLLAVLLLLGTALMILGITLTTKHWTRGLPWDRNDEILIGVRWIGDALGLSVGLWWWWRAPANPTGRLLYLAATADWVFLIAYCWPGSRVAAELTWFGWLVEPCVALILLSWPTGRPSPRILRAVLGFAAADGVLFFIGNVFNRAPVPSATWPDPYEARFSDPTVWHLIDPVQALGLHALPALVILIVLVRRRRAVPPAVRPLVTPITIAGVLVAASFIVLHVGFQLFGSLLSTDARFSVWQLLTLLGSYFMVGFVALGVLGGATRRRRAVARGSRYRELDLRSAPAVVSPSAAAVTTTGDPSAQVRYPQPDGTWIDSTGAALPSVGAHRLLLPVLDDAGTVLAALDVDEAIAVSPLLTDLALGTIAARSANERAAALADARRTEVRERSRELVAATDLGRRDLERNLHDGAQQLLVGLALTSGLAARRSDVEPASIIDQITQVRGEILALIDSATPAALSGGLAAALHALAAVCPISVVVDAVGDLPADDPLALNLYLAAGEAITNTVKHSAARAIAVYLLVSEHEVELAIGDNGSGNLATVPPSIASRVAAIVGEAAIVRETGVGGGVGVEAGFGVGVESGFGVGVRVEGGTGRGTRLRIRAVRTVPTGTW